jgi:hypothetical protein
MVNKCEGVKRRSLKDIKEKLESYIKECKWPNDMWPFGRFGTTNSAASKIISLKTNK